ncbi:MAG: ABC transporter ATP-binding protein [Deltaproteobacteria bacterium]|nr:ABC transporter ATP-binding protein [Deltaproteobacteria bacterium]
MSAGGAIEVRGLGKTFTRRRPLIRALRAPLARDRLAALKGLDLRVGPGEVCGIIGPNGAGKTTLLKILAGLILPEEGEVRIAGHAAGSRDARAALGLVTTEERSFYWRLSARENLRFFGALHDLDADTLAGRIEALAGVFSLGEVLDRPVRELSSGNRGRLALARGLLHRPRVLLLDEVARSLDPGAARKLRTHLRKLVEEEGLAAVYASHDLAEVERLCHRVVLLSGGVPVAAGTWEEVRPEAERIFELEEEAA